MRATAELTRLQRSYRPWAADRMGPLLQRFGTGLGDPLAAMARSGRLVIGEVGRSAPNAMTLRYADGSNLVVANSGLLDFFVAVAQTLFGGARIFDGPDHQIAPALRIGGVADRIAALYQAWRSGEIWAEGRLRPLRTRLDPDPARQAELLAGMSAIFVLAHELGHVLGGERLSAAGPPARTPALTREDELRSDAAAAGMLVERGQEWGSLRMAIAGAVVALRILSGLRRLGHRFPGSHPPPRERLIRLWGALREHSGSEERFWFVTTIAYSFDEHLEAAENLVAGREPRTALTAERMYSRLSAALEEAVRGRQPVEGVLTTITRDMELASAQVLRRVAETAARVMHSRPAPLDPSRQALMVMQVAALFHELMPRYPTRARAAFERARVRTTLEV